MTTLMEMLAGLPKDERRHKAAVERVRRLLKKEEGRAIGLREIAERCKLDLDEALDITKKLVSSRSFRYRGRSPVSAKNGNIQA